MKKTIAFILTAAFVSAALSEVVLENDVLKFTFAGEKDGYALTGIVNKLGTTARFIEAGRSNDLWRLEFICRDADGSFRHVFLDNRASAASRSVQTHGDKTYFLFKGVDVGEEKGVLDVVACVDLKPKDGESEWTLRVQNRSRKYALYQTFYPCLNKVMPLGKGNAFIPHSLLGGTWRRKFGADSTYTKIYEDIVASIPGWRPPVASFHLGDCGLYVAAHDPTQRCKNLRITTDISCAFETVVEDAGIVGKAAEGPRYPVTIAAISGDWWATARRYRSWAQQQTWAAKGPILKRADYPKTLADTDLLFRFNESNPAGMSNTVERLAKQFKGLNLIVHWYCWSQQPYCVNFPEFFPARAGVREVVRFAQSLGIKMIPYVDPRLWDVDLASWVYAKKDACRSMSGELTTEVYYPKHRLAVMCPAADAWGEVAMKMTTDAVMTEAENINGCGFDGVYHDQVACSRQIPCWAEGHSHAKGGGDWWFKGTRKAFARIHDWCASRGAILLSEGTGDMCLDQFDGFLKASGVRQDEVPFYPAVYGGFAVYYGNYQSLHDSIECFRAYQMRDFTSGVLLGWLDRWNVTSDEFSRQRDCLARCARTRRAAAEFMVYGTLEDELRFVGEPQPSDSFTMHTIWHVYDYHYVLPTVTGTVWKNTADDATGVIVANAASKVQTIRFRLPAIGLAVAQHSSDVGATPVYDEQGSIGTLTLPPCSTVFLRTRGK